MNTAGWDITFVIDVATLNDRLRGSGAGPTSFDVEQDGCTARGTFGSWSIVPDRCVSQSASVEVAIASGALALAGGSPVDIGGTSVSLCVALGFEPATSGSWRLGFRVTGEIGGRPAVEGIGTTDPSNRLTAIQRAVLPQLIATWLAQHAADVGFTFAVIQGASVERTTWPAPTGWAYGFTHCADGRTALAVLSVVDGRNVDALPRVADAALLTPGSSMGLAISPAAFMRHVFLPLLASFSWVRPGQLQVDPFGRISGALDGTGSITAAIDDTQVDLQMQLAPGIVVEMWFGVSLDSSSLALELTPLHTDVKGGMEVGNGIAVDAAELASAAASAGPRWAAGLVSDGGFKMMSGGLAGCFYVRGAAS